MTTAKYFVNPFGVGGSLQTVPDTIQSDGSVSYQQGWGPFYTLQLGVDANALPISEAQTNQMFFDITNSLQFIQKMGTFRFITSTDNLGTPLAYEKWAFCFYDNMDMNGLQLYQSKIASNSNTPTGATDANWNLMNYIINAELLQQNEATYAIDTGVANAYVVNPTISFTTASFQIGSTIKMLASNTNTAASTLNVSSLGIHAINKRSPNGLLSLVGNEILANQPYEFFWNGTVFILLNPSIPSFYGISYHIVLSQTFAANSDNLVHWGPSSDFDNSQGLITFNGSPNFSYTANISGYFEVSASVTVNSFSTSNDSYITVYKNGVAYCRLNQIPQTNGSFMTLLGSLKLPLAKNDTVQIYATNHNPSGSISVQPSTPGQLFQMTYLGT